MTGLSSAPQGVYPNRHPWLAWLLHHWMLALLGAAALLTLGGAAMLPKWIPSSPRGFEPEVKVSGLDLLQVRSLRRTARRLGLAGDAPGALHAWQTALANDLADADTWRGLFQHLAQASGLALPTVTELLFRGDWLVRLGGTNQSDLLLLTDACLHYGMPDPVCVWLQDLPDKPPEVERAYLKALFLLERPYEFAAHFVQLPPGPNPDPDPTWPLYEAAYLAISSPMEQRASHRSRLQQSLADPDQRVLAARLALIVASRSGDPNAARTALATLEAAAADQVSDHARLWRVLAEANQIAEASALSRQHKGPPPGTPAAAAALVEALLAMRQPVDCRRFLEANLVKHGRTQSPASVMLWASYAENFIQARAWQEVRRVAEQMVSEREAGGVIEGYATFLEGYAAHNLMSGLLAETRFAEAARLGFPVGDVGLRAAIGLQECGFLQLALAVLDNTRQQFAMHPLYWRTRLQVLMALHQDEQSLLEAARRGHELEPDSLAAKVNYAAALLITRQASAEALQLTFGLRLQQPGFQPNLINHAIALAQSDRLAEAAQTLRQIPVASLDRVERSSYYTAWLEVHSRTGEHDAARQDLDYIDKDRLFPRQLRWVEATESALLAQPPPAVAEE